MFASASVSSSTAPVEPTDLLKLYKNSALVITPPTGKKVTKVVLKCAEKKYCVDVTVGTTVVKANTADEKNLYVQWEGSLDEFAAIATSGQIRITEITVVFK